MTDTLKYTGRHTHRAPWLGPLCLLMVLLAGPVRAEVITAQLSPLTFTAEEPARLTVTISGQQSATIAVPEVDGLVFHRRGQSSQFQMINGAVSSSVTYTYLVQGLTPGNYTIPPLSVTIDGTTHETDPLTCTVLSAGDPAAAPPQTGSSGPAAGLGSTNSERIAFIRLLPEKTTAYTGEIVPAAIKAYFLKGIKVNLNGPPALKGDGVLLNDLSGEPRQREETVDGTPYTVLVWETALTGIKEGSHALSMEMDATLLIRSRGQRQLPGIGTGLFQDDLFDDLFARYENRPVRAASPVVVLTTKELPEKGRPAGYSGAIGSFTLKVQASPVTVDAGEPVTLTMTVAGSGNFDTVGAPVLSTTAGLKTYTPSASFNPGSHAYEGTKVFEQAIVISDPGVGEIPPALFSYFDPHEGNYLSLFSEPIPVTVRTPAPAQKAADEASPVQAASRPEGSGAAEQPALAPLKLSVGSPAEAIRPLFVKPWFVAATIICLLAILGVTGYRLCAGYRAQRPGPAYQKRLRREKKDLLASLEAARTAAGADDYLDVTQQAFRSYLALLWQTQAGSLTTSDILRRLGPDSAVTQLFVRADQAAYGAIRIPEDERRRLHDGLIESLNGLS